MEVASGLNGYLTGWNGTTDMSGNSERSFTLTHVPHMHNPITGVLRVPQGSPLTQVTTAQPATVPSHSVVAWANAQLRSIALAIFESVGDAALPEGAIVGWDGGTPPVGWAICDGTNGTVDLTERFVYLTRSEEAGVEHRSASTYSITSGSISSVPGHRHTLKELAGPNQQYPQAHFGPYHDSIEDGHSHALDPSMQGIFNAPFDNIIRYQLRFIQYIGE